MSPPAKLSDWHAIREQLRPAWHEMTKPVGVAIGVPAVAAAILAFQLFVEIRHFVRLGQTFRVFESVKDMRSLGIDVSGRVVCDLARRVAQSNALVVGCSPDPNRTTLIGFLTPPKTDVMTVPRIIADRLFKG